jgi:photosystem II stability/assembly factor-like uncharacterized protein
MADNLAANKRGLTVPHTFIDPITGISDDSTTRYRGSRNILVNKQLLVVILLCTLLLAAGTQTAHSTQQHAPISPRAASSTLIDVSSAGPRIVAVGERGHVLYSDDRGDSWQQGKMPFLRMLTGVSFVDGKRGWAVGHQSMIFHSRDGGETWQRQLEGFQFQQQANEDNLVRTREAYEALAAELTANPDESRALELEDALFAFEDAEILLEEPAVPTNFHDVWFLDENLGWAVGAFGRLVETRDGGSTWVDKSHLVATLDGFHLNAVTGTRDGQVFLAGEGGTLFRSMDRGQTWEQLDAGYYDTFFGIVFDPVNNSLMAFGIGSALYRSSDLGSTWEPLKSPIEATFAGGAVTGTGQTILVGPAGAILVIDGTSGSMRAQPQANRMNHSTVLVIEDKEVLVVGAGGTRRVQLN